VNSAQYISELREQVATLELQLERTKRKSANRRTALKQMNRSVLLTQRAFELMMAGNRGLQEENKRLHAEIQRIREEVRGRVAA